jgi:hypothetical protein
MRQNTNEPHSGRNCSFENFFAKAFSAILVIDQPTNGMVASGPGA